MKDEKSFGIHIYGHSVSVSDDAAINSIDGILEATDTDITITSRLYRECVKESLVLHGCYAELPSPERAELRPAASQPDQSASWYATGFALGAIL